MSVAEDRQYMRLAIELAQLGKGKTSPNPTVGAILVKDGRILSEAYHRGPGKAHAEAEALHQAGHHAKNATLYVTLEPCCHVGKTGPCTEAVLQAGVRRVVFAVSDPDPRVSGRGERILRRAGVSVTRGVMRKEAALQLDSYLGYHQKGRPFVTIKVAQSLDGRLAAPGGESKWISGESSRRFTHRLRAEVDAIITGTGTVANDDPRLTVRMAKGRNPFRIVVTSSLSFPTRRNLFSDNGDYKTIIATNSSKQAREFANGRVGRRLIVWHLPTNSDGRINLIRLLAKADDFGIRSVLVEAGTTLLSSFIDEGLVDKMVMVTAPMILGCGQKTVVSSRISRLAEAIRFDKSEFTMCGQDMIFVGYPRKAG